MLSIHNHLFSLLGFFCFLHWTLEASKPCDVCCNMNVTTKITSFAYPSSPAQSLILFFLTILYSTVII